MYEDWMYKKWGLCGFMEEWVYEDLRVNWDWVFEDWCWSAEEGGRI